jgi:hypothetical protein
MFNEENLQSLFRDTSRWGMAVANGNNSVWVIRRHYWEDNDTAWRFTIDQETNANSFRDFSRNTVCVYELTLEKDNAEKQLIEFLKVVNLWGNK